VRRIERTFLQGEVYWSNAWKISPGSVWENFRGKRTVVFRGGECCGLKKLMRDQWITLPYRQRLEVNFGFWWWRHLLETQPPLCHLIIAIQLGLPPVGIEPVQNPKGPKLRGGNKCWRKAGVLQCPNSVTSFQADNGAGLPRQGIIGA